MRQTNNASSLAITHGFWQCGSETFWTRGDISVFNTCEQTCSPRRKKKTKQKKIQPKISFWTDLNLSVLNIWRQFHSLAILQAPYLILRTFVFHFLLDNFVQYTLGLVLEKTATLSSVFLSWLSTSLLYDSLAADYWITSIYVSSFVPLIMLVMHLLFHEHRNMETWKKKCFRA